VKRTKVALDANVPERLVRLLNSAFGDQGFEFLHEPSFAAATAEDEVWAAAFRRFGGRIAISADRNIAKRPHQLLAFAENGLISFFLDARWHGHDMSFKAAHLILWWPRIYAHCEGCAPKDCWWVPATLREGKFKKAELPSDVQTRQRRKAV
jgi:hypothetical protein